MAILLPLQGKESQSYCELTVNFKYFSEIYITVVKSFIDSGKLKVLNLPKKILKISIQRIYLLQSEVKR